MVLDIKGENYDITAGYRAAHGQAVYAFSPFDEDGAQPPLEPADRRAHQPAAPRRRPAHHRPGPLPERRRAAPRPKRFFNDQARNLFLGLGLVLLETPELPRTIGEMLRQSSRQGAVAQGPPERPDAATHGGMLASEGPALGRMRRCPAAPALELARTRCPASSPRFNAPLTIFADALVDAATSADDFRLEDVRRRRMSIYVRIPPNRLANARPLLNLFFSQLVSLNTPQLPEHDPTLKLQCLLVHDEFTAMGRVGILNAAAGFLAGYNLRLLTVVQAMSQLDCGLRRQGRPHLRHQPRAADPLRAARAARRRRVQRDARPLHRAATTSARPVQQLGREGRRQLVSRNESRSAARCCCRRSSRNWAASAWC